jgi:hypothetical protein
MPLKMKPEARSQEPEEVRRKNNGETLSIASWQKTNAENVNKTAPFYCR